MESSIKIEKVSYTNNNDLRILKACLTEWFKNPKDLNLTSPTMRYPFDIKQWIANSYSNKATVSYVLKKNNWIIGHMSLQINENKNTCHLFHVFIDQKNRGHGYGRLLVEKALLYARDNGFYSITLYVNLNNDPAFGLYHSIGFKETGEYSQSGSPKLKLDLNIL